MAEKNQHFDPNFDDATGSKIARFPSTRFPVIDADTYVRTLTSQAQDPTTHIGKALQWHETWLAKGSAAPPSTYSYSNMQIMPDQSGTSGIVPWPGLDPSALYKIVQENVAPQMIIGMRIDDVLRYSRFTSYPWRPGWRFELTQGASTPSDEDYAAMAEARAFIENCGIELTARERDENEINDFQHFITKIVRDTLTYDGIAVFTDMAANGKIKSFRALAAGNIRLVNKFIGYNGDYKIFAVLLDQVGSISKRPSPTPGLSANEPVTFTRDDLIWYVRNARTDLGAADYGLPEIEQSIKLIQAFSNILELLGDQFTKSAIPNGMLLLKGKSWTQKQIDMVQRVMENLLRGITKRWGLPVLATPDAEGIELLNFNDLKDTDGRFNAFLNQSIGGICTLFRFPVRRFGYFASGQNQDNSPLPDSATKMIDDDDPGLAPLLMHIENLINQYIVAPNWKNIRFAFTGKNPKEDARQYQAKMDAMSTREARAQVDLPSLMKMYEEISKEFDFPKDNDDLRRELIGLLSLAPQNPNQVGMWQTVLAAYAKTMLGGDKKDADNFDNMISGQKDPASSEAHGGTSGVRRDSSIETKKPGRT